MLLLFLCVFVCVVFLSVLVYVSMISYTLMRFSDTAYELQ
jgi:hypothetical protein